MKKHFWFSKKQKKVQEDYNVDHSFCEIDGEIIEYTEMTSGADMFSSWEDVEYLGEGVYSHNEPRKGKKK